LGDSQQAFSNRLGLALNTIARYETSRVPTGEVLLMLALVAEQHGHLQWRDFFRTRYVADAFEKLTFQLLVVPKSGKEAEHGYLMVRLEGAEEIRAAQRFMDSIGRRRSTAPRSRKGRTA
jgi:transcriptional regulator with XRE-family HTH domain